MTSTTAIEPPPFGRRPVPAMVSGTPSRLVVALHGYGSSGDAFLDRLRATERGHPADTLFVAPDGPAPALLRPGGRQWYPITNLTDVAVDRSAEPGRRLREWLRLCQSSTGFTSSSTVVVGFSQGGVMAEVTALAPALATQVVVLASLPARGSADPRSRRTYIVGSVDRFVPVETVRDSARGSDSVIEVTGLGHDMSDESLAEMSAVVDAVTTGPEA